LLLVTDPLPYENGHRAFPVAIAAMSASRHPHSKETPAQATLAMGQRWVIAAHVWLEFVN
jgi:hypothetical protein